MATYKIDGDLNVTGNIYKNGIPDIPCEEITYSALKAKRDAGKLIPGALYRITDFVTTAKNAMDLEFSSAKRRFDIIVRALSNNILSEDAKAMVHPVVEIGRIAIDLDDGDGKGAWFHRRDEYDGYYEGVLYYAFYNEDLDRIVYIDSLTYTKDLTTARYFCGKNSGTFFVQIDDPDDLPDSYKDIAILGVLPNDYFGDPSNPTTKVKGFFQADISKFFVRFPFADGEYEGEHYYAYKAMYSDHYFYAKTLNKVFDASELYLFHDSNGNGEVPLWNESIDRRDIVLDALDSISFIALYGNIAAWQLKYSLDNDDRKYDWAVPEKRLINVRSCSDGKVPMVRCPDFDSDREYDGEVYHYAWGSAGDADDGDITQFWYSKTEDLNNGDPIYNPAHAIVTKAVVETPTGVIHRFIDEYNNDCAYDFKNILSDNHFTFMTYFEGNWTSFADASSEGWLETEKPLGDDDYYRNVYSTAYVHDNFISPYVKSIELEKIGDTFESYDVYVLPGIFSYSFRAAGSASNDSRATCWSRFESVYDLECTGTVLESTIKNVLGLRSKSIDSSYIENLRVRTGSFTIDIISNSNIVNVSLYLGAHIDGIEYSDIRDLTLAKSGSNNLSKISSSTIVNSQFNLAELASNDLVIQSCSIKNSVFSFYYKRPWGSNSGLQQCDFYCYQGGDIWDSKKVTIKCCASLSLLCNPVSSEFIGCQFVSFTVPATGTIPGSIYAHDLHNKTIQTTSDGPRHYVPSNYEEEKV